MTSVNYANPKLDQTVRVFDQFFGFELIVQSQDYDAVYSYFRSIYTDATAAGNFTVTLFRIANQQSVNVLSLLQQIQGQDQLQLTSTFCYYLNNLRSNSTLLGVNALVAPNYYAARNVRQ